MVITLKSSTRARLAAAAVACLALSACGGGGGGSAGPIEAGDGVAVAAQENDDALTEADQTFVNAEPAFAADEARWEEVVAAAEEEGSVVVHVPNLPPYGDELEKAFEEDYPEIDLQWLSLPSGQASSRVQQELEAGQAATLDAVVGGHCFNDYPLKINDEISDDIIDPALFEPGIWPRDRIRPLFGSGDDPDFYCGVQSSLWIYTDLYVNPELVDPESIDSWGDLLDPAYRGQMVSYDIPAGAGTTGTTLGYLGRTFGDDYVEQLIIDQEVAGTTDLRQMAEWLVRGRYAIALGLPHFNVEPFRAEGLEAVRVIPEDGPGPLTGGWGTVRKYRDSAHPNASTLFVNWFLGAKAQKVHADYVLEPSLRLDVDNSSVPQEVIPVEGVEYPVDDYSPGHYFTYRLPLIEELQSRMAGE